MYNVAFVLCIVKVIVIRYQTFAKNFPAFIKIQSETLLPT